MASNEQIKKLREDREARAQARIQMIRELNLKKYGRTETTRNNGPKSVSNSSAVFLNHLKPEKDLLKKPATISNVLLKKDELPSAIPKKIHPQIKSIVNNLKKPEATDIQKNTNVKIKKNEVKDTKKNIKSVIKNMDIKDVKKNKTVSNIVSLNASTKVKENTNLRKSIVPIRPPNNRKSFIPTINSKPNVIRKESVQNSDGRRESVFDRLYKPKTICTDNIKHDNKPFTSKLQTKRNTTFEYSQPAKLPIRRSISAVHFKKIGKNELKNCIHKWASIGEKINKVSLKSINEDENLQEMVSAVKSEQKKVKFQTSLTNSDEMRLKLSKWLEKNGKSIDTYQHLNCFGVQCSFDVPKLDYEDENKENVPLENDSDNESFAELNGQPLNRWRSPSNIDSMDYNESFETAIISEQSQKVDDALIGALNDLADILRNGYSWEEGARWLRSIRDTYNDAQDTSAYWECRAALEEARGNMPASMQCWEQALAKGTEKSVAEANIDQLLAKFMQLKINPGSEKKMDPKLIDAKNVFKSTLLRFALQGANKQSNTPTVTPVRRSARLNHRKSSMKLFNSVQKALDDEKAEFRPNKAIAPTP